MNQARSSWSKSFTPILVEKSRKIIAFGWPRNTQRVEYGKDFTTGMETRVSWGCVPGLIEGGLGLAFLDDD